MLAFLLIIFAGCIESQKDIDVQVKQVVPLTPGCYVEISKDINMSNIKFESPQDYIPTNSYFQVPIEISNNIDEDFENIQIVLESDSPIIYNLYLYSYSGHAFEKIGENTFKFDNKLLARQTNEIMIMGQSGFLEQNLIDGSTRFSLRVYGENEKKQYSEIYSSAKVLKISEQSS
jgi:hypothetical protein